jgi:hypothetical protein
MVRRSREAFDKDALAIRAAKTGDRATRLASRLEQAWALRNSDRAAARSASEVLLTSADIDPRATALAKIVLSYLDYRFRVCVT